MNKTLIFLLMTVLLIGLATVSAEEITQDNTPTTTTTPQTSTNIEQPIQTAPDNNIQEKQISSIDYTKESSETSYNNSHRQDTKNIQKTQHDVKTAPSDELSAIETSTTIKLENAFRLAKIEIDNAQSTYDKEQIPESVKTIVKQIAQEAQQAETIYAESSDSTLTDIIRSIRNNAGYADLLIHPEKLTDPNYASKYNTRPLDMIGDEYNLLTIVAQRLNESTQESVYINLTSDEFQNLYNDVGEIHHPGEYDRYGHVILVNKTKFVQVTTPENNFELIPFPLARIYLEGFYKKGIYYTQTFASCANGTGWYHVDGSTLTKQTYYNYTLEQTVEGNSGIVFWKLVKSSNTDSGYELTDERYYPDINGHPPDNMPKENNDENGIYYVGYVIKTETGGIHIDGVIVEYRAPEQTYDVNFTARKVWNDSNNQDGIRPATVTIQLLADGEKFGDNIVLYAGNNWRYDYINLPRYRHDNPSEEIVYTINELNVPDGYHDSITGYTVTNTHIPETKEIEVLKEWDDDHNRDGIRPTNVTVDLYANNALKQTVTINNTNWRYTFKNLPVYQNGKEITYNIRERTVTKYTTSIRNISNEFIITNKYTPTVKNVTVKKIWNDNNNQDGIRPNTITIQLLKDETPYLNQVTLNNNNNWTHTFQNLPVNADGKAITYTAIETSIPTGYTATNNGLTITNTHTPETTQIEVFKEWDDDHNRDGIRPGQVVVNLLGNGEVVDETVLSRDNHWRHDFVDLAVYSNGRKITYTVEERPVANYTSSITRVNNEFIIKNTHKPLVKELKVIKVWEDNDNEHELRPASVEAQLFADGEKYGESITLSANNDWMHQFTDLPVNFDGKEIFYVVKEVILPEEYYNTIEFTAANEITITNIFDPEHAHVKVIKEWDDNHDSDKLRPTSIQVQLYANGEKQGNPVTLSQSNYWRHSFDNLLKYVDDVEVEYTVREVSTTPGYTSSIVTLAKNEYAIVNKHDPEKINITVNKVWNDNNNQDGIRPTSIRVLLLSDGEEYETVTLSENNGWKHTFTGLTKYFDGKEIDYDIEEIGLNEGYTTTYNGYTITNVHTPETIEVNVVKEWSDEFDQDGLRPESIQIQLNLNGKTLQTTTLSDKNNWTHIFKNLPKYTNGKENTYTITETKVPGYTTTITNNNNEVIINNVHTPDKVDITVNKVWNDNNDQDGIRPDTIRVELMADGERINTVTLTNATGWKYTFTGLDKYHRGNVIKYTVNEIGIPDGYSVSYNGYTITNTHIPEVIELNVVKEWLGNFDQDGIRPESIQIQLNLNGKTLQTTTLSDKNNWTHIFKNLPKYTNGKENTYTITETKVPGYTTTITNNNNKVIIRNVHIPEKINITVNKVWNDNNNQDGIRPTSIRVVLLGDGEEYESIVLSDKNGWKYTFTNLDKYYRGNLIKYTVDERGIPTGYTVRYNGYTITNTHTPETIDVKVIVEWDDLDDIDEIRPENVTIIIYANDEPIENRTITPDDDWKTIFEDLPEYENGTKINYTADEILPDGYTRTIEIGDYEIIITNIHRPKMVNITVRKVWIDDDNRDNIRPESIKVQLLADGKEYATVTLSAMDNWEYPFINLPKTRKGKTIKYTVKELDSIHNYTTTTSGYTITNKHDPETVDVKVNVEWDDLNDTDGIRPENVTIIIYANDEPIENRTITPDDNWKTIFEDLPKYENGTKINYTADEILPDGYTRTIEIGDNEINITNIHRPERVDVTVDIVWDDLDDIDGIRPDTVNIILYADGKEVDTVIVTKDTWNTVFKNLPKTKDGKTIKYTIDEVLPNGYTKTITADGNHFTVTNVHRPDTIDIPVRVDWDDLKNIDGIRPDSITLMLYANGEEVRKITVTPDDDWTTIFEGLPRYDNGKSIKYTIDEILPDGYTRTITLENNGFVITNIHRPKLVWTWKLVEILPDNNTDKHNDTNPVDKNPINIRKQARYNNWNMQGRYSNYYSYNRYSGYNRYNMYNNYYRGSHRMPLVVPGVLYRLYIQLFNSYLMGNITFADFIVILEKEGFDPEILNFDENGTITIDYESLEDVPDNITVEYKNDDIPTTSDEIDTSNPDGYESPVIDAGEVEVPAKESQSESSSDSSTPSISTAGSQSSNSQPSTQSESQSNNVEAEE